MASMPASAGRICVPLAMMQSPFLTSSPWGRIFAPRSTSLKILTEASEGSVSSTFTTVLEDTEPSEASVRIFKEVERSEEHTSELQSQSNLVCRLLLEKKKHIEGKPGTWSPASRDSNVSRSRGAAPDRPVPTSEAGTHCAFNSTAVEPLALPAKPTDKS